MRAAAVRKPLTAGRRQAPAVALLARRAAGRRLHAGALQRGVPGAARPDVGLALGLRPARDDRDERPLRRRRLPGRGRRRPRQRAHTCCCSGWSCWSRRTSRWPSPPRRSRCSPAPRCGDCTWRFTQGLLSKLVADTAPAELLGTGFGDLQPRERHRAAARERHRGLAVERLRGRRHLSRRARLSPRSRPSDCWPRRATGSPRDPRAEPPARRHAHSPATSGHSIATSGSCAASIFARSAGSSSSCPARCSRPWIT